MKLQACLGRAVNLLTEEHAVDGGAMVGTGIDEYSLLITNICHHVEEQGYEDIPDIELESSIHRVLLQMSDLKERERDFDYNEEFYQRLEREFGNDAAMDYRVIFPLNIPQIEVEKHDLTFKSYGIPVRPIEFNEGESLFEEAQRASEHRKEQTLDEDLMNISIPEFPDEFDHSFWEVSLSGPSLQNVLTTVTQTVQTVIGKINYIEYANKEMQVEVESLLDQVREVRECVTLPFFYLFFSDDEFRSWRSIGGVSSHGSIILSDGFNDEYGRLHAFPHKESRDVDEKIASALREFGMGVAAQSNRDAFLYYWQSLEEATLIDEYSGSDEPLERLKPFVDLRPTDIYSDVIQRISNKRNRLVHSGKDTEILIKDVELLHHLASIGIDSLYNLRARDRSEIRGIMKYGDKPDEKLDSIIENQKGKISDRQDDIDSARNVLSEARAAREWRQVSR